MNEIAAAETIAQLPLAVILAFALNGLAVHRGWVTTKARFDEMKELLNADLAEAKADRSYWRGIALRALGVAEKATGREAGASPDGD